MALDYAGRRNQRRSVACNSDLLARATRLARVLRLEHDPQPGQNGRACAPPRFLRVLEAVRRDTPADVRMSLKGVGRLAKAPWRQRFGLSGPPCVRSHMGIGLSSGRRMPERGKSRFATVSRTYIRRDKQNGKRGGA